MNDDDKKIPLTNPVVLIALINIAGVFVLIGAAMIGIDKGVLKAMSQTEFARGLITYLFAVVTIGTAVVLVVFSLTHTDEDDSRFNKGKEVLSLLLGVFGTIVGFYFGSEVHDGNGIEEFSMAPPSLSAKQVSAGGKVTVTTYVSGGELPYRYSIIIGDDERQLEYKELADDTGWIKKQLVAPSVKEEKVVNILIGAKSENNDKTIKSVRLRVLPK